MEIKSSRPLQWLVAGLRYCFWCILTMIACWCQQIVQPDHNLKLKYNFSVAAGTSRPRSCQSTPAPVVLKSDWAACSFMVTLFALWAAVSVIWRELKFCRKFVEMRMDCFLLCRISFDRHHYWLESFIQSRYFHSIGPISYFMFQLVFPWKTVTSCTIINCGVKISGRNVRAETWKTFLLSKIDSFNLN